MTQDVLGHQRASKTYEPISRYAQTTMFSPICGEIWETNWDKSPNLEHFARWTGTNQVIHVKGKYCARVIRSFKAHFLNLGPWRPYGSPWGNKHSGPPRETQLLTKQPQASVAYTPATPADNWRMGLPS